jgi:hypothetical protein
VNTKTGKTEKAALVTTIIAGAKKRLTGSTKVPQTSLTVDQTTAQLQSVVDNRAATVAAQATAKAKVAAETAAMPALDALLKVFLAFIRLNFGNDAEAMADFGQEPDKAPTPLSAEQKAVAAAKREATREARGTTSAKQKRAIKGNVTATLVVTPATPAPAEAPAAPPVTAPKS